MDADSAFPLVVQAVEGRRRFRVTDTDRAARSIDLAVVFAPWELAAPVAKAWLPNLEAFVTVEPGGSGSCVVTFGGESQDPSADLLTSMSGRSAGKRSFKDLRKRVAGLTGGA